MKWSVTVSHMYSADQRDVVVEAESESKARVAAFGLAGEGWYVRPFEPNQARPVDPFGVGEVATP